tara:strand:+ start:1800 stop:2336 length:537 start_codon:yes stop_codon:yes gene_type:complete
MILLSLFLLTAQAQSKKPIVIKAPITIVTTTIEPSAVPRDSCPIDMLVNNFYYTLRARGLDLRHEKNPVFLFVDQISKFDCYKVGAIACQTGHEIELQNKFWKQVSCGTKQELVDHELGHFIGLPHTPIGSIETMTPALLGGDIYMPIRGRLMDNLVKQKIFIETHVPQEGISKPIWH